MYKAAATYMSWKKLLEVHIIDFDTDIYGRTVSIFISKKIRNNQSFSSLEELKTQITKDVEKTRHNIRHNIAVLHPSLDIQGGANKMMLHLARALQDQWHKVKIYVFSQDASVYPDLCAWLSIQNMQATTWYKKFFSLFFMSTQIWDCSNVYVGNSPMHAVAYLIKKLYRSSPRIFWWHHHVPWLSDPIDLTLWQRCKRYVEQKLFVPSCDVLLASSNYLAKIVSTYTTKPVQVLYPIVDDVFLQPPIAVPQQDASKIRIFLHTRLEKEKNIQALIELCRQLQWQDIAFECNIAGKGSYEQQLRSLAYDIPHISFVGQVSPEEVVQELDKADIFFMPSKIESFGMSAIEAVMRGCQIYCYNTPALRESLSWHEDIIFVQSNKEIVEHIGKNQSNLHKDYTKMSTKMSSVNNEYTYSGFSRKIRDTLR